MKNFVPFSWRYVLLAGVCAVAVLIGVAGYQGVTVQIPDIETRIEIMNSDPPEELVEPEGEQPDLPPEPESNNLLRTVAAGLLLLIVTLFLATALRTGKNFFANRRLHEQVERSAADSDPEDDLSEVLIPEVTCALDQALDALDGSLPPRNAIVQAWHSLELAVTAVGFERTESDTATDFVTRALQDLPLESGALDGFLKLYHLARFTEHEMVGEHTEQAHGYLTILRTNLDGFRYSAPVAPQVQTGNSAEASR